MCDDCTIVSLRFPQKLWRIVNECKSGAIRWNLNGTTLLLDYKKFQQEYLDSNTSIFKTKNITSFIRQLNLYGFRKVTSHNRDPSCNSHNPDVHEFLHDHFRAGRVDLLSKVCRKSGGKVKRPAQRPIPKTIHSPNSNVPVEKEKDSNRMSRLRACQLALTEALEQITKEYSQKQQEKTASNSRKEREKEPVIEIELYPIENNGCDINWILQDGVPVCLKEIQPSDVQEHHCACCTMSRGDNPHLHFQKNN